MGFVIKLAVLCIVIFYTKPDDGPLGPKHVTNLKQILSCDVRKILCSYEMVLVPEKDDKRQRTLSLNGSPLGVDDSNRHALIQDLRSSGMLCSVDW